MFWDAQIRHKSIKLFDTKKGYQNMVAFFHTRTDVIHYLPVTGLIFKL